MGLKPELPLDSLRRDVTPKWLGELEAWLEQKWFTKFNQILNKQGTLTVTDGTVTVTDVTTIDVLSGGAVTTTGVGIADLTISGYTAPTAHEVISATYTAGGSSATSFSHVSGSTLCSFTTPTAPTIVNAGIYAIWGSPVYNGTMSAGQYVQTSIDWSGAASSLTSTIATILKTSTGATVEMSGFSAASYFNAGSTFSGLTSTPSATIGWTANLHVQRIS